MYLLFKKFYIVFLLMCTLPSAAVKYINPVSPRFPVLAWYSIYPDSEQTTTRYKELADCGFNISFTHFRNRHSLAKGLKACSGTGVKIMVMCGDELENNTSEVVNQFKNDPNVCGWFLYDEPTCDDFKSLRAFRDRILAVDKKHQLYLNLYPLCFADALKAKTYRDYVERFAKEVDLGFISFDHYPVLEDISSGKVGVTSLRSNFYANLEDIRNVSETVGQPFWAFALSTAHDPYPVASREILHLEVMSDLAYGAQGIQYFTYWNAGTKTWNFNTAPISMDGHRTHVWYLVRDMNREIEALTKVFLGVKVIDVAHTGETLPEGTHRLVSLPSPFKSDDIQKGDFLVSHLKNGNNQYLLILNRDLHKTQKLTLSKSGRIHRIMPDGQMCKLSHARLCETLAPGEYLLYQWK